MATFGQLPLDRARLELRRVFLVGLACVAGMMAIGALQGRHGGPVAWTRGALLAYCAAGALCCSFAGRRGLRGLLLSSGVAFPAAASVLVRHGGGAPSLDLAFLVVFIVGACVLAPAEVWLSLLTSVTSSVGGALALWATGASADQVRVWVSLTAVAGMFAVYGCLRFRRLLPKGDEEVRGATARLIEGLAAGAFLRLRTEDEVLSAAVRLLREQGVKAVALVVEGGFVRLHRDVGPSPLPQALVRLLQGSRAHELRVPLERLPLLEASLRSRQAANVPLAAVLGGAFPPLLARIHAWTHPKEGLVAPLVVQGQPHALLGVGGDELTPSRASAVVLFARHVETALENVRAHRQAAQRLSQVERLQAELVAKERFAAMGQTAGLVAGEIREPLEAMRRSFAALSAERALSPEGTKLLAMMDEEGRKLAALARDLLFVTRPLTPSLRPVDLAELAQRSLQAVAASGQERGVRLSSRLGPVRRVQADPAQLQMVLENLLRNAVQASPDGGAVTLEVAEEGPEVLARVDDAGPGVSEELKGRIFDPFFTTRVAGTGLGLSIVRRVAQSHGGRVELSRSPTGGARFELRLPSA